MKVKIVKCSGRNYWYKDLVGQTFEVQDSAHKHGYELIYKGVHSFIDVMDAEIVEEKPKDEMKFPFRVRCIDITNAEHDLVLNGIYTVTGSNAGDYYLKETPWSYMKSRFEIVEEDQFKLGPQEYVPDPEDEKLIIDDHYSFNYTLTDKDREAGTIKVDPYFVSRLWNVGAKDPSGVIWHIFKTCARFGDKNDKEREITAIYKSIKRLAELEGVKLD
jgi:hypothetical protein